jgi:adenosylhomocysteinase
MQLKYDIKDLSLASKGKLKIEWAGQHMEVLNLMKQRFAKEKPLTGLTVGACLHVTAETANLMLALKAGGAKLGLCASNPLSTQDEVAASLVKDFKIPVFAIREEDKKTYYQHLKQVLDFKPQITLDDGGDLVALLHKLKIKNAKCKITVQNSKLREWEFYGSCEETTTGVIRLRSMENDRALKVPVMAVNDSQTKHFFDNRYGTGQSTIDGILRATNILLAGKNFVVIGFGWCSRGIALRARGMGAKVIICEVDPVKALEAVMDGYQVMSMKQAVKIGGIFVTATGDKNVININHIKQMKNGAILANSGHFNVEIDVSGLEEAAIKKKEIRDNLVEYQLNNKKVYLLAEGRLVNLAAAEGHPAEVMDMSFANQALAVEYLLKNKGKLKNKVYVLPEKLDQKVASLKLKAMGIKIDQLTKEQKNYLSSWCEGT